MSKDKNAQKENVENAQPVVENEQTAEEVKAQQVLRAKLPALSEANFNFEKRTGNVFTAAIVKVFDENGEAVIEDGEQKEKLTRKVVEIEDENGELLPEYEGLKEDLQAKRAAAYVLGADSLKGKLEKKIEDLTAEIEAAKDELGAMETTLSQSCEIVMSVELPERAARVNVSAKLTAATDKLGKMKAMLLAAGLSEDEINEQLNG